MSSKQDPGSEPMIARDATYHRAPDALRKRVHTALAKEAGEKRSRSIWHAFGLAAAFAVVAVLSWNVALFQAAGNTEDAIARDVVAAHVRSLMAEGRLNDVISTDRHTVKPWFAGKLDYAPPVVDFANEGFTLLGGRLDYVNGRAVAALTYKRRQHIVNVFVWPAEKSAASAPQPFVRQGYSVLRWTRDGMSYWAVSDIAPAELTPLASMKD